MAQQALPPLAHVNVLTSSVIPAPVAEVWRTVRAFGSVAAWSAPVGLECITSDLLPGSIEGQLGALRHIRLGTLGFVEQLEALDDDRLTMKWRAVSHPLNASPFPGSLLNYKARLRLHEVTVDNKSFLQLECSFETEHESREVMKRELKARQEANIRGLLSVMEVNQVLRAEQLAAPLQPNLIPVPPLGVSAAAPTLVPGSATFVDSGHFAATRELSPRTQAALASLAAGPSSTCMGPTPITSAQSSLASTSWGTSLDGLAVARGASGVSVPETPMGSIPVPNMASSIHDSVNTVGSAAISKAIQQAQAQAQAHGMGSQLARLNARLQQQGLSLADMQRPAEKRPAAPAADPRGAQALAGSAARPNAPLQSLPQVPSRTHDDLLVSQKRKSEPDALSGSSRVLSL